jgi:hypothetical protein
MLNDINGYTLTNIEFILSRNALDTEEVFSMGNGALCDRCISKAFNELI